MGEVSEELERTYKKKKELALAKVKEIDKAFAEARNTRKKLEDKYDKAIENIDKLEELNELNIDNLYELRWLFKFVIRYEDYTRFRSIYKTAQRLGVYLKGIDDFLARLSTMDHSFFVGSYNTPKKVEDYELERCDYYIEDKINEIKRKEKNLENKTDDKKIEAMAKINKIKRDLEEFINDTEYGPFSIVTLYERALHDYISEMNSYAEILDTDLREYKKLKNKLYDEFFSLEEEDIDIFCNYLKEHKNTLENMSLEDIAFLPDI